MPRVTAKQVVCPTCAAQPGEPCRGSTYSGRDNRTVQSHWKRIEAARHAAERPAAHADPALTFTPEGALSEVAATPQAHPSRLWVDDLREPPSDEWHWVKTSQEAIDALLNHRYDYMSLDHDLGGDDTTRRVVLWLCEHGAWPGEILVHSANPVGVEWLQGMIARYAPPATSPPEAQR